jgi:O-antigen/teichoic acid export membrane protein
MAGASAIWSIAVALAPMLVGTHEAGSGGRVAWWLEQLLTWTTVATALGLIGIVLVGHDIVPLVFGSAYGPVALNMLPLGVALVARAPASVARLQSLVADRPGDAAVAAGLELATFVGLGYVLAVEGGSFGACVAALAGAVVNAMYLSWRMRAVCPYSPRGAILAALLVLPLVPLAWIHGGWAAELAILALAFAGYCAALFALRVVRIDDARRLVRTLRRGRS